MVLKRAWAPNPVQSDLSNLSNLPSDMEHTLRCNALKCRKELGDRALVTTCSHIFCPDCATRLGLNGQRHEHRNACPACGTHLSNPDDAVITNLNPSEDYKTSVLSGLSPNVIMECATRALSFWAYQTTQEVIYQEYMGKTLTDKYSNLSVHLDKVINDANAEITNLHNKLSGMKVDHDALRKKNDELAQAFKDKNRKLLQTQELYDKLKRKAMMGQIQDAAEDAVDSSLQGTSMSAPTPADGYPNTSDFREHAMSYGQHRPALYAQQQQQTAAYNHQPTMQSHLGAWPKTVGAQSSWRSNWHWTINYPRPCIRNAQISNKSNELACDAG
ncbi:Uu.00g047410.m01.CDS01 [Anthostomella pinea]|uniref:Uu.00g047410.m01.CDS01 n=1 Tax=Anthostomella pinea TaxID=933095 RepID=A0AAI8YEQ7_9PEZI|nr:Uu.00g047410.m01.CDS01 [Anthostomella pinea]